MSCSNFTIWESNNDKRITSLILKTPGNWNATSYDFLRLNNSKIVLRLVQSSGLRTAQRLCFKVLNWIRIKKGDVSKKLCISQFQLRPATPSRPPADPRALAFFCLGWQIPGGRDSWAVKYPGVGTRKEGKCPVLRQHCNIFHWSHSRIMPF